VNCCAPAVVEAASASAASQRKPARPGRAAGGVDAGGGAFGRMLPPGLGANDDYYAGGRQGRTATRATGDGFRPAASRRSARYAPRRSSETMLPSTRVTVRSQVSDRRGSWVTTSTAQP